MLSSSTPVGRPLTAAERYVRPRQLTPPARVVAPVAAPELAARPGYVAWEALPTTPAYQQKIAPALEKAYRTAPRTLAALTSERTAVLRQRRLLDQHLAQLDREEAALLAQSPPDALPAHSPRND